MSMRQLGASVPFGVCGAVGVRGAICRRPANATHFAFYVYPSPNEEWPVPAGYGNRSHPVLWFWSAREQVVVGIPANGVCLGELDLTTSTNLYGVPIRLPSDCESVIIYDGGATGSTAITRGRGFWYAEWAV
jgi:hypothetical protein